MEKYLIFDFDGVIADTFEASVQAVTKIENTAYEVAAARNLRYASEKPNHTRDHTLTKEEMHEAYVWTAAFGAHMKEANFSLFEDFVSEVEQIDTSYKAVVSSGSQQYIIPALAETNIEPTHILGYENHHSKEEKIESICADWGVSVRDVFYFTDTLADVYELQDMIAREKLIGVSWGYCGKDLLLKILDEKYILNVPKDIHTVL